MVRYLNYMVQFLRFQSDTTNNDVRNILLNIRQKCLLIWFGLPPALFQLVLAAAVPLVAQTHAVLKGKPLTVVSKHLLARCQASSRPHQHPGILPELPWMSEFNIDVQGTTGVIDEMRFVLTTSPIAGGNPFHSSRTRLSYWYFITKPWRVFPMHTLDWAKWRHQGPSADVLRGK